jgi:hypothetical protein
MNDNSKQIYMKRLLCSILLLLIKLASIAQNNNDKIVIGVINDVYVVYDDINLGYAKKLSEGVKGDSCLIYGSLKSNSGSLWLKVATIDTVGYIMAEFVSYDKNKVKPLVDNMTNVSVSDYIKTDKANWILYKEKIKQERLAKSEKNKQELLMYISKNDLFILSHSFPEADNLKYPGFRISIFNSKKTKTIKYIWFTLTAYNAVDDVEGTKTVQAIGPVYPLKIADYEYDIVFRSNVVDYCKITNIKIQYMDGSVTLFNKSQVETILIKSKVFLSYLDNSSL